MIKTLKELDNSASYDMTTTPLGDLYIITTEKGICAIFWNNPTKSKSYKKEIKRFTLSKRNPFITKAKKQLNEYFSGKRKKFELILDPSGTDFQIKAWKQLSKIPYGKTISYQDQAKRLGDLNKARAVGGANSKNPLSIVVPCHRVIAKNGDLTGFASGLDRKQFLLDLESQN